MRITDYEYKINLSVKRNHSISSARKFYHKGYWRGDLIYDESRRVILSCLW